MDPATTIAVFSFLGVVVTAVVGAIVAIYTNRSEKKTVAETAMEKTLRERIILRDETIVELKRDLEAANEKIDLRNIQLKQCREELRGQGSEH